MNHHTAITEYDIGLFEPIRGLDKPLEVKKIIQSSPYTGNNHLLQLETLEPHYQALSLALQSFQPKNGKKDYAFIEYSKAFNIEEIIKQYRKYAKELQVETAKFQVYIIAFRSILHYEIQESEDKRRELANIDKDSHREANISGGLLKYWYGTPDDEHAQNLATCWWRNREDAKKGGGGTAHSQGMKRVRGWYKKWDVEEYVLEVVPESFTFSVKNV